VCLDVEDGTEQLVIVSSIGEKARELLRKMEEALVDSAGNRCLSIAPSERKCSVPGFVNRGC
jgi:hypothetical protein